MKDTIIVDLDGTLSNDSVRAKKHLWKGGEAVHDWASYFAECGEDTVVAPVLAVIRKFDASGFKIVILTARNESCREETMSWLGKHKIPWDEIVMRPREDRTDDNVLKISLAANMGLTPENVLFVMEDRQRVVDAWRAAGFTCFQVAPGKF